ncbi:hypothetical protein Glove_29g123 [Diversispora epigaea]|uniref:mitogen-activated protein kinase kinase n=1 Tax=Diversispora epigaea TaxID=1348612 RepID=A0A397JRS3_9GLOM|nr:hypothetical protein Glove_29g123 [Diversispora epigaea]
MGGGANHGNENIDKFIQDAQLNANHQWEVIEWISYDRFKDVKQIGKGEFGTIHYAMWIDGKLENGILKNDNGEEIFDNFVNFNDVLNEMAINLKARTELASIQFYGITQDPETLSYMMISDFGLSKLIGENPNNSEKKNIFGVLPYIAPEVLSGEEYTKAADVYSYGIIAYEIVTGFPPYHDIPHGQDLAMKICNGL